jgi:ribosomal protein S18 acetylase RimI-like enzyme
VAASSFDPHVFRGGRPVPPSAEVRPFQRRDREQLTALVNAHVGAVLPGVAVSVNAVLSQLEREPEETIVDPWAVERATLVAVVRDAVVAGAHLVRYGAGPAVSDSYRDAAEIRWLVFAPGADAAADALVARCVAVMTGWGVARMYADGSLPAPAVYGVPDVWPHVGAALERAGFVRGERVEAVLVADVADLPGAGPPPLAGLAVRRTLGGHATRFSALLDERVVGFFEVQADLTGGGALSRLAGWGDVWELHVEPELRRRGIGRWLVGHGADWLRLARIERLLDYAIVGDDDEQLAFDLALGFRELTRTRRGWQRAVSPAP